jgi:glucose/mannose transport system permease protein
LPGRGGRPGLDGLPPLAARPPQRGAGDRWDRRGAALFALLGGGKTIPTTPLPETHGFNLAFIGIIIAAVWQQSGYTMAMYLAGLRGVPEELREAARVDGCNELQVYRHIVLRCSSRSRSAP